MKIKVLLWLTLCPLLCEGQVVKNLKQLSDKVNVTLSDGILSIAPLSDNAVRIKFYKGAEDNLQELVFTTNVPTPAFKVQESASAVEVKVAKISVVVDKQSGKLSFFDAVGKPLVNESAGSRKLEPGTIQDEPCFMAEQTFDSPANEAIFGLGQFQDGHYNLRGVARRLTQVNTQISIPFIYSSRGYGLLWHQYGLTDFNPADNAIALNKQEQAATGTQEAEVTTIAGTRKISQNQLLYNGKFSVPQNGEYSLFLDLGDMGNRHFVAIDGKPVVDQSNMWLPPTVGALVQLTAGEHQVQVLCKSDNTPHLSWKAQSNTTTFRSPVAKSLDYVVFAGSADDVIAAYRKLSGNAPLFPKWAYGFWQCRERYSSDKQLVETIEEFRKRSLPVDVIVQDWQYWGNNGWGVPKFDEKNYPNPKEFIGKLHDLNAHFNISIWSNPDKNSDIGKEFVAKNRFISNAKWLDYFNPETRTDYWNVLKTNMFDNGVDSWWMDAVEPENDALKSEKTTFGLGDFYRLTYPYFVSKSVYEGQRATSDQKRVCILTRSAYLGQQRYGIINWSGDIGGTWDTFKRQIVAGLNYSVTGFPYWTTDIGGFFRPGRSQYTDEKYQELLTRWFQWGVFNPVFRIHGYMTETEPWKYGQKVEDNMRKALDLRYSLMPYIYSEAWQITKNGSTLMRPLVMDFCNDVSALLYPYEYMFGKSLLVAPVTEAGAKEWKTYLPQAAAWYDFRTGEKLAGGKETISPVSPDMIPVYVKAGTILPIGPKVQYASEKKWDDLEIRVYPGANGSFTLYEDENDTYNYEKGIYSTITFKWDDNLKTLTIDDCKGTFSGMLAERKFHVVKIAANGNKIEKDVVYKGKKVSVK
jgi:alpha-D-xyloside xylohydrolase